MKTPYQILRETSSGPCVDCFSTAAAARSEVEFINATRATRKHGMRATYIGHIDRVGDEWQRLIVPFCCAVIRAAKPSGNRNP